MVNSFAMTGQLSLRISWTAVFVLARLSTDRPGEALLSHARAGNSVPVSENGQIVWLSPEEIYRRLGVTPSPGAKAS